MAKTKRLSLDTLSPKVRGQSVRIVIETPKGGPQANDTRNADFFVLLNETSQVFLGPSLAHSKRRHEVRERHRYDGPHEKRITRRYDWIIVRAWRKGPVYHRNPS